MRWLAVWLVLAAGAQAQTLPAVLDEALPFGGEAARLQYRAFLGTNLPRAFALSPDGKYGWQSRAPTAEATREAALESCRRKGGTGCAIYAEGLAVLWPGRVRPPPPPGPIAPLIAGKGYEFTADPRFIWWGPQAARGVYVFGHGRDIQRSDARGEQPQAHVRLWNNAGFDVVRFDRDPLTDEKDPAAAWLRAGLRELRARGWKMIVAGGQSRGGWNALQMLDTPGLADVVIAISAATNGTDPGAQATRGQPELYTIFSRAKAAQTRVAIVQFRNDPFEQDPDKRFSMARELLAPRVAGLLLLNQPDGLAGHGAGGTLLFAQRFGACLLRFGTQSPPVEQC